jgi:hypothetical protein
VQGQGRRSITSETRNTSLEFDMADLRPTHELDPISVRYDRRLPLTIAVAGEASMPHSLDSMSRSLHQFVETMSRLLWGCGSQTSPCRSQIR